jgi:hypothetical protein
MRRGIGDEGARPLVWWPFAVVLQGEAANHREVRRSRAGVLSVAGKGARAARQVWITKASESDTADEVSKA